MKPVWCIYPDPSYEVYRCLIDDNVVSIGFGGLGNVTELFPTRADLKMAWMLDRPDQEENSVNQLYSMLYRFAYEMQIGDWVVYPSTRHERSIHVGKVKGDYYYDESHHLNQNDLRPMEWITALPREAFSQEALKGINVNLALFRVRNPVFLNELKDKLSNG